MVERTVQLVLHYDGARFAGWQRQPNARTVQGVLEDALGRLCNTPTRVVGAGRTDAGVHARGQAASANVPVTWTIDRLRQAVNALLPDDVWVAAAYEMRPEFHARYSAVARRYTYHLGTDAAAQSPFRSRWEWVVTRALDRRALDLSAGTLLGEHTFRAYAVRGTAPAEDDHRCVVHVARWRDRLVNIHPSLLPAFPGLDTHARALKAGVRFTGCTVHFVREGMDDGPIIVQAAVPVLQGDDEADLAARVLKAEHRAYPLALRLISEGCVTVADERVAIKGAAKPGPFLLNPSD